MGSVLLSGAKGVGGGRWEIVRSAKIPQDPVLLVQRQALPSPALLVDAVVENLGMQTPKQGWPPQWILQHRKPVSFWPQCLGLLVWNMY